MGLTRPASQGSNRRLQGFDQPGRHTQITKREIESIHSFLLVTSASLLVTSALLVVTGALLEAINEREMYRSDNVRSDRFTDVHRVVT